ncbi:MAG: aconitase family protein, partial [Promethearchaeota archaeon]
SILNVPERATITNMGAETGATTSIFPSDNITREFLKLEGREEQWIELKSDSEEDYERIIEIDLSKVVPLVARPHSPGNVVPISEVEGIKVDQVAIGSCTNSSLKDMLIVAELLKDRTVHNETTLGISPGSRQVLLELSRSKALKNIISSGARVLECACGPCIGMGFAPKTDATTVRTFNRNFFGRSGTETANIYLTSPETAVAAAIFGELTDPRMLQNYPKIKLPDKITINDSLLVEPSKDPDSIEIIRGPNIAPLPESNPLSNDLTGLKVLLKVEDNVTTDDILPAGAKILPFRSNLPKISEFVFEQVDPTFSNRALETKKTGRGGVIVAGENYGQGSSREHAALAPMYLGIKIILAKSFARIHRDNLVNFGILPFTFSNPEDIDKLDMDDELEILEIRKALEKGQKRLLIKNRTLSVDIEVMHDLSLREVRVILEGGKLNYTRNMVN